MGTSWLYEAGTSALQAGALTDFSGSWGALLHLSTAVRGSLFVGLDNYAFAAFEATTYVSSPKSLLAHPPSGAKRLSWDCSPLPQSCPAGTASEQAACSSA